MTAQEELAYIGQLHQSAYTRAEVDAADAAFRAFRERYPDYPINPERFHGWHDTVEALKERELQAREMGLSAVQVEEREALLKSTIWDGSSESDLYDETRLQADQEHCLRWLDRFPDDPAVLSHLETINKDLEVVALLNGTDSSTSPPTDLAARRELVSIS